MKTNNSKIERNLMLHTQEVTRQVNGQSSRVMGGNEASLPQPPPL